MKRLFIFVFLLLGVLSFSNPLKNVNLSLLEKELLRKDYSIEKTDGYLFFNLANGKYKQNITIYISNGEIQRLSLISSHFNLKPNKNIMGDNLNKMFEIIKPSLENKNLIDKIENVLKNINNTSSFGLIEEKDYMIRTTNLDNEKSVSIEL